MLDQKHYRPEVVADPEWRLSPETSVKLSGSPSKLLMTQLPPLNN